MSRIPLMLISDNPNGVTGLGRINRELALHIHENLSDVFRVGTAGIGGNYSSKLPFPNYPIQQLQNMVPCDFPQIWKDFAGDEQGVLLCLLNLAWCGWLACPERLPVGHPLREFLGVSSGRPDNIPEDKWAKLSPQIQRVLGRVNPGPFKKWLYCPVDGDLPDGTLGLEAGPILRGFDRVLGYTRFASKVIDKTMGAAEGTTPNLPHGLDTSVFYPRDRKLARETLVSRLSNGAQSLPINDDIILVGCVATNSMRKNWGLCMETCGELLKRGKNVFLWGHTNAIGNDSRPNLYWNLLGLANQFGLERRVILTTDTMTDDTMAWAYSACDVTLGIGSEGMGYPLMESLGCGVPVVHMTYAGGAEYVPKEYQVEAPAYHLEGKWMIRRPTFVPSDWADKVEQLLAPEMKAIVKIPDYMIWDNLWPNWKAWLLNGLQAPQGVQAAPSDVAAG